MSRVAEIVTSLEGGAPSSSKKTGRGAVVVHENGIAKENSVARVNDDVVNENGTPDVLIAQAPSWQRAESAISWGSKRTRELAGQERRAGANALEYRW